MKKLLLILLCVPLFGFGQDTQPLLGIEYLSKNYNPNYFEGDTGFTMDTGFAVVRDYKEFENSVMVSDALGFVEIINIKPLTDYGYQETIYLNKLIDTSYCCPINYGLVYYNGKLFSGKAVAYHENGQIREERNYVDGKKEGLWQEWYKNGMNSQITNWKNGKPDGLNILYHENGRIWYEYLYKEGANVHIKGFDETGREFDPDDDDDDYDDHSFEEGY
jgi:hypothetical protein